MAKIFEHSDDADVRQLSIFNTPATNTSVQEKRYLNIHPVSGITPNSNVIHFSLKGNSLKYLDLLDSRLYIRCKIRDMDGHLPYTAPPPTSKDDAAAASATTTNAKKADDVSPKSDIVFPINHLLQSMWKQVEVFLGGKLVSTGSTNYHYKSMIKTLLYKMVNDGVKRSLMTEMFYEDTAGGHDLLSTRYGANTGVYKRKLATQDGMVFEMEGTLNEDALQLKKYLINGVDFDLKLYPVRSAFALMSNNVRKEFRIIIEDAVWKSSCVDVSPSIVTAHTQSLDKGGMAQYFFDQAQLNSFTVGQGQRNFSQTIFQGNIPHRVVVAMVSAQRYNGDYMLNPYLFHHFNATNMAVLVNDVSTPHRPLSMDFSKGQFASPLFNLIRTRPNVLIDVESFDKGYSLFVFDINSKQNSHELALQNCGNVRLEIQFGTELTEAIQVLVYGEYESCIQVDHARAVYYTPL